MSIQLRGEKSVEVLNEYLYRRPDSPRQGDEGLECPVARVVSTILETAQTNLCVGLKWCSNMLSIERQENIEPGPGEENEILLGLVSDMVRG